MNFHHETYSTPVGDFSVAFDPSGALVASAFGAAPALLQRMRECHLLSDTPSGRPRQAAEAALPYIARAVAHSADSDASAASRAAAAVRVQLREYFTGSRRTFEIALAPVGTAFQRRVWTELQRIPFGETRTYRQIADAIGAPAASRAVGRANAMNPVCLIVPCHRVIGSDGSLTGFAFGEELKRQLLDHEARAGAVAAA